MSKRYYQGKEVSSVEFRHATHVKSKETRDDLHVVKEILHLEDGTSVPNLNLIKNYKRSAYISKPGHRNYKEKRVREKLENLIRIEGTQSEIYYKVARALKTKFDGNVRRLLNSPYIYGLDVTSASLLAAQYRKKYAAGKITNTSVAGFDIETNVLKPGNEIIISSITFKDKAIVTVQKEFLKGIPNPKQAVYDTVNRLIGETLKERGVELEVVLTENEAMCVVETFKKAHEWSPDIISSWGQAYDLEHSVRALENAGIDPANVFSDPSLPPEYRYAKLNLGRRDKVTETGKTTPISPEERWNQLSCPAGFYFLDAMGVYWRLRAQSEPKAESYSLEHILSVNELPGKLDIPEAKHLLKGSLDWHRFLQKYHPLEYVAYNIIDCIDLELLDEKTGDLSMMVPTQCKLSEYQSFKSQPKRVCDAFHWFALGKGYVLGTTGEKEAMTSGWSEKVVSIRGWITNLAAHLVKPNPVDFIEEIAKHVCSIYIYVYDLDIKSSYPTTTILANVSRETCKTEIINIEGMGYYNQSMQSLNLVSGRCNGTEVAVHLLGLPTPMELLELYKKRKA